MWKQINDLYSINESGEVRNDKTRRILKGDLNYKGYLRVSIFKKNYFIHRLVAITFIPNPFNYSQVNHKDGNKLDNNVSNLEWCNNAMNVLHGYKFGLFSRSKLQLIDTQDIINSTLKAKELAIKYSVSEQTIYAIRKNRNCKRFE